MVPNTLTDLSGYGWGDLTYRTSDSDYHYYDHSWDSSPFNHGIKVKFTQGTGYNEWVDGNSGGDPSVVDDNADGFVYCHNAGGTLLIKILKPTTADWISSSSGGGTSSAGSSVPSGSNYMNSQGQLVFVISSGSPSSDGNIAYKIFRRLKGGTLTQAYVVPHTSGGTDTEFNIGLNLSLYDKWELRVESSTGLVQSAVLSVHSNNKKVFCNFW